MHPKITCTVLGCGWLGLALAKKLLTRSYTVRGTTTREQKLPVLANAGIIPYLISLESNSVAGDWKSALDSQILVLNTPPGRKNPQESQQYLSKYENLLQLLPQTAIEAIIFVSSTSVYGNATGIVDEKHAIEPVTSSGKALAEVEDLLRASAYPVSILRAGGLIGPDRHPGRFFRNRSEVSGGDAPVNLVHQEDMIEIIIKIMEEKAYGHTWNAVADLHPAKKEFYPAAISSLGADIPIFLAGGGESKCISNVLIKEELKYEFKFSDPMQMI